MAGPVRKYANKVVLRLGGGDGDAQIDQLRAAATGLDDAARDAPATFDQALQQWRAATDALRSRLVRYLLTEVPVPELPLLDPTEGWSSPEGARLDASLGPLAVHVEAPALRINHPMGATQPQVVIGPLPPNAVRAHLEAGPVAGDGSLVILPDGVNGSLALHLGAVEVAALASLRRVGDQPSFAAVFAAGFTPGIQLGFGFQLTRVGGVIGINRAVDQPALAAKLRDGSPGEALFPLDVGQSARRALGALEAILPPRVGSSVVGPTLRLSWLEVAGQGFCSIDVGVLLELPGPQRVVIVGIARAGIPTILKLRIDVVGVIDFTRRTLAVDASLVDSGLMGIFSIYGDAAFRACWGAPSYTVLSIGGFYPGFRPEPADIPPLRRLGFHLDSPVPGINVRAEGYLAVTSNTVQLGGYVEAGIHAAGCGAHGFSASTPSSSSPRSTCTPTSVPASGRGLRPDVRRRQARRHDRRAGPGHHPRPADGRDVLQGLQLRPDVHLRVPGRAAGGASHPRRARPQGRGDRPDLPARRRRPRPRGRLRPPFPRPGGFALVQPRGGVVWQPKRVPLSTPIDRLDGAPLGSNQQVQATVPNQTSGADELFAPGSFITLSQAEALNRPAYERLPAGVVSAGGADLAGPVAPQATKPNVFRKVRGEFDPRGLGARNVLDLPGILLSMLADRDATPALATTAALVSVGPEQWASTSGGGAHASASSAFQAARLSGNPADFAAPVADLSSPVALGGL